MHNGRISHYQIVAPLGAGGMGLVYSAIDLNLDRRVALKVLPEHLAGERDAIDRLRREARAASALNEPGICTIYEIGEDAGVVFIAMELLEGETLGQRLKAGRMPVSEVVDVALEVISALDHAHGRGVMHRDITPANIFLLGTGRVKLLDFGLAKIDPEQRALSSPSPDRTMTVLSTTGSISGTVPYMSPEQARGEAVDSRSDLFSFGTVLHEALEGKRLFVGSTAEVLSAILTKTPPPLAGTVPGMPPDLDRVLAKALEKDRELRYQTAAEMRADLRRVKRDLDAPSATAAAKWPGARRATAVATLVAAASLVYYWSRPAPDGAAAAPLRATFTQISDLAGLETFPSLSADGQTLLFASAHEGRWRIYSQRIGGRNLVNLTPDSPADDTQPVWSPDGTRIAFRSSREGGGIFVMGATGESVRRLTDFGFNPTWSPDGTSIAVATEIVEGPTSRMSYSQIWVVDVSSGARRMVTDDNAVQPRWSPSGERIAYWKVDGSGNRDIYTVPSSGGAPVAATRDAATDWSPAWTPDGNHLFFSSDRGGSMNLWRVPIDEQSGQTTGPYEPVTTPALNSGLLSFSADGSRMVYVAQTSTRNIHKILFDPARRRTVGAVMAVTRGTRYLRYPSVSPDGRSLVYTSDEKVIVSQIDGSSLRQLTDGAFRDRAPRWSPDGTTLAFYSNRSGTYEIWSIRADGSGLRQLTFGGSGVTYFFPVWSPDGGKLAFGDLRNRWNYLLDLAAPWTVTPPYEPAPPVEAAVFAPWSWSPSGLAGWALKTDGQSGGLLVYDATTRTYRHHAGTASHPLWLPGGRGVIAHDDGRLVYVDMATGASQPLPIETPDDEFTVSPDGTAVYFTQTERTGDIWMMSLAPTTPR